MKKTTYQGVTTLEVLEGADNYNRWIAETIKRFAKSPILELGAGTGNISDYFLDKKNFLITEYDLRLVSYLKKKYTSTKHVQILQLDIAQKPSGKLHESFSTVFAVNVFEHIKDDEVALKNAHRLLKKNGRIIILVPAKKFAYTRLDKNLGHYRRYEKQELKNKLEEAGFTVEKIYFFNIVGLLSWIIRDKVEKQNMQLDRSQIALFDKIVPLLRSIESVVPIPIGISFIAVARKI